MKNISKDKIEILDVRINPTTRENAILLADQIINKSKPSIFCTVNTEFLMQAQKDPAFKNILNKYSSLNLADGIGTIWASRFLSIKTLSIPILREILIAIWWLISIILIPIYPRFFYLLIPERIAGSDFIWEIAKLAQKNNYKIFLLGGAPTVAEHVALKLQTDLYGLRIAGVHSGDPKDTPAIITAVNKSKADILLVAYGAPKQELWLKENLSKTPCRLGIGVGGTFDFIAGVKKRSPKWMQKVGLEWLYRLIQEPSRIKRQLNIPHFMWKVLLAKLADHK